MNQRYFKWHIFTNQNTEAVKNKLGHSRFLDIRYKDMFPLGSVNDYENLHKMANKINLLCLLFNKNAALFTVTSIM